MNLYVHSNSSRPMIVVNLFQDGFVIAQKNLFQDGNYTNNVIENNFLFSKIKNIIRQIVFKKYIEGNFCPIYNILSFAVSVITKLKGTNQAMAQDTQAQDKYPHARNKLDEKS